MKQPVITISREFGSGGRQIGEKLAKALDIPFYDRTLIDLVAQKSGYPLDFVIENDQRVTKSMLFQMAITGSAPPWLNGGKAITKRDTLFAPRRVVVLGPSVSLPAASALACTKYSRPSYSYSQVAWL